MVLVVFFLNAAAPSEIYTLSLHDALPILLDYTTPEKIGALAVFLCGEAASTITGEDSQDRKSTRLNSSHGSISYAVFCLEKKNAKVGTAFNMIVYNVSTPHATPTTIQVNN